MKVKRYTDAEVRDILREAEDSENIAALCRKYNISELTLHRWRAKHGVESGAGATPGARLAQLEAENARLKRTVSKQAMDIAVLRGALNRRA